MKKEREGNNKASNTINVSNNTTSATIDLSGITTFGELKNALPSTGSNRVPGVKQLKKQAEVVLRMRTETGSIEVYSNGFFTYEELEKVTVFGVDRCECPELYSYSGRKERGRKMEDFSEYPWDLILVSAGEARLNHNADSREEYQSEISMDAPESENNIAFSVKPEHEIREEEEAVAEWHTARNQSMKAALKTLTEKQYAIMMMDRVEKLTQEQIAKRLGISRRTLREHLEAIEKKLNKVGANTRHFAPKNLD